MQRHFGRLKLAITGLLVSIFLAGCSGSGPPSEDLDLKGDQFNQLIFGYVTRFEIPVIKNIGFVELPSMGVTHHRAVWLGERNLLPFDSFSACGDLCRDLQRNGYAGEFVPAFSAADTEKRAELVAKYYGEDTSFDAIDADEITSAYQSCLMQPFNQVFRVYVCAKAGNFHYAYAIKTSLLKQKKEIDYANQTDDARFTLEGYVTWYDLYDWIEARK